MIYNKKDFTLKNGQEVMLRSPEESDAEKFSEFRKITSSETHFMARNAEEVDTNIDSTQRRIKGMRENENALEITAFIGTEIVGSCGLNWKLNHQKLSHRASFGISIKEKFWDMGLGSLLLNEAIEKAKEIGLEQLELDVYSDNERAQHLYKKFGFREYGRLPNAYKLKDGSYRGAVLMFLNIKKHLI